MTDKRNKLTFKRFGQRLQRLTAEAVTDSIVTGLEIQDMEIGRSGMVKVKVVVPSRIVDVEVFLGELFDYESPENGDS